MTQLSNFNMDDILWMQLWLAGIIIYINQQKTTERKTKNLLAVKLYLSPKIYNVSLLTATYSCKLKNVFTNVEINVLKSDVNWILSICNNQLQEIAIEISTRFLVKP